MPRIAAPLTDTKISKSKPKPKDYKLADGYGLYLLVTSTGGKLWRFQYRFDGKQKQLALGAYPDVSLAEARKRRQDARELVANNVDPNSAKKAQKQAKHSADANSFEVIAREWYEKFSPGLAESTRTKTLARLENDLFPWLGPRPIAEITAPELLGILRRVEGRGALDTAHRVKRDCGQIFRYAIATGRALHDPSSALKGAIPQPVEKHFAAITNPKDIPPLLHALDGYSGSYVVRAALKLSPLVFVRPGELRKAEWKQIDLEAGEWCFFVTKTKKDHIVPLAKQAVEILKELKPLTGDGKYVFRSIRGGDRCMSENTILAALRRMDIDSEEMCGHGFRAMARTVIRERLKIEAEFIEIQLAHKTKSPNGAAYDRVAFLDERKDMMQRWADYLDELRK